MQISITNETGVYKKASVVIAGFFAALFALGPVIIESWALIPDSMRDALPEGVAQGVSTLACLLVIAGRYVHFKAKPDDERSI